jgi:hypothetical protein
VVTRSLSLTGVFPVAGRHVSPEVAFNVHAVDARADIYSLGAVWYDMLFCPVEEQPLDRGQITHSLLSQDGQEFLCSMLAERRGDRIASMKDVQSWLDMLADDLP